ncbi:hypothetical protein EV356DRAFT_555979 [Viridothelium virens]|uniref:Uncharacterized protein n=1 Tax=Viridothelium virens TaxID=1048519 RepID=A0A6A6GUN4_VIRVR|nr:hypothetical protein EV356DRAFT_555979 [Viridothelium virens]
MRTLSNNLQSSFLLVLLAHCIIAIVATNSAKNLNTGNQTLGPDTSHNRALCQSNNCSTACNGAPIRIVKANNTVHTLAPLTNSTNSPQKRALLQGMRDLKAYARRLWAEIDANDLWSDLNGPPTDQTKNEGWFFPTYPEAGTSLGIRTLAGNTAVLIMTRKGVFMSLIPNIPTWSYHDEDYNLQMRNDTDFVARTIDIIRFGNPTCGEDSPGIEQLMERGELFHEASQAVYIYILTPVRSRREDFVVGLDAPYEHQIMLLRHYLDGLFPHAIEVDVIRFRWDRSGMARASRIVIEIDTHEGDYQDHDPNLRAEYGAWRLWVGEQWRKDGIFLQDAE